MTEKLSVEQSLLVNNKIKLLEPYQGAKVHVKMQCLVCNHIWDTSTPLSKTQTFKKNGVSGCPECNRLRKEERYEDSRVQNLAKMKELGLEVLTPGYDGRRHWLTKDGKVATIKVKNVNCGHVSNITPANILESGVSCSRCGHAQRKITNVRVARERSDAFYESLTPGAQAYRQQARLLTERTYRKYKQQINPNGYSRKLAGQNGGYHLDHIVSISTCIELGIPLELCVHPDNLTMLPWQSNLTKGKQVVSIPSIFYSYFSSTERVDYILDQIRDEFDDLTDNTVILAGHSSLLFDSHLNIAVFVLTLGPEIGNHRIARDIMKAGEQSGTRTIIIFEDELIFSSVLVMSKLRHILKRDDSKVVYARQCTLKMIEGIEKNQFVNANHIQGSDQSQYAVGAYFNDQLVAVMTFCRPRIAMTQKNVNRDDLELSRFCTSSNHRVIGIASKMLKFFINTYEGNINEIYSYADLRWSSSKGSVYEKLGFELTVTNPPQYYYVQDGKRKHRWGFRKDALREWLPSFDPNKTELQNLTDAGYHRVYDCGTLKYKIRVNKISTPAN